MTAAQPRYTVKSVTPFDEEIYGVVDTLVGKAVWGTATRDREVAVAKAAALNSQG